MKGDAAQKLVGKSIRRWARGKPQTQPKTEWKEEWSNGYKKKQSRTVRTAKTSIKRGKDGKKNRKGKNEYRKEKQARSS